MNKYFFSQSLKQFNTSVKRKRFYKTVDITEIENINYSPIKSEGEDSKLRYLSHIGRHSYHILLDGKKCLSAFQDELIIPSKRLAVAIAAEYQRQKEVIEFNYMPLVKRFLTRLLLQLFALNWQRTLYTRMRLQERLTNIYRQTKFVTWINTSIGNLRKRD